MDRDPGRGDGRPRGADPGAARRRTTRRRRGGGWTGRAVRHVQPPRRPTPRGHPGRRLRPLPVARQHVPHGRRLGRARARHRSPARLRATDRRRAHAGEATPPGVRSRSPDVTIAGHTGGVGMTYSIVARDESTGQLGVGVQTCFLAVGSIAPWARPGVGAVATQAFAELAYGPRCLDALGAGRPAGEALAEARAADPMAELRQVGVVAAGGDVAAVTGERCVDHAGHVIGDGFTTQANMVGSPEVWGAMAAAFEGSTGVLARRLLAALEAGEAAGGDARGRMSAALLVVEGTPPDRPGRGTVVDLRVDRSEDPLSDLVRLLDAADAFGHYDRATDALFGGDAASALDSVDRALEALPGEENFRLVRAGALLASGATDAGLAELRALVSDRPTWEIIVRGLADWGVVTLPEGMSFDAVFA